MSLPVFVSPHADGLRVRVRLAPGARREAIEGTVDEADGAQALKVAVTAPPLEGRANTALVALLARAWNVPKTSLTIVQGTTSRHKRLHLAGDPARLGTHLDQWWQTHARQFPDRPADG